MAEQPQVFDPLDPEQAAKRAAARQRLDAIDPAKQPGGALKDPKRREWFEAVYALSGNDPANVPWGNMVAHPLLADWLAKGPDLRWADGAGCRLRAGRQRRSSGGGRRESHGLRPGGARGGMGEGTLPRQQYRIPRGRSVRAAAGMARRLSISSTRLILCRRFRRKFCPLRARLWPIWSSRADACW